MLIGDAVSVPSLIKVGKCDLPPSSTDIKYLDEWRDEWKDVAFQELIKTWGV
ncbi:hypothetical protein KUC3_29010 [Alteromonas sp. KC3]|uniref:hypothetical protein n=1 Tax=unclassified Alteromonas TaxID=2614992 RepID=UPI0019224D01|nr:MULTISPECIES: hypothetical protein [unclassified Alteromonas]BCO20044.1 hypothetical protein KUC3_29010 [Alteromonas sp. KC3]BCO24009.1 hypothetical protein KUC14_28780 [Alteromonas sp. KC14]